MRQKKFAYIISVFLVLCSFSGTKSSAGDLRHPDRIAIIQLLKNGNYDQLERQLTSYLDAYEAGKIPETWLGDIFYSFTNTDPNLEERFAQWISLYPLRR